MYTIHREQWLPLPIDQVFPFFAKAENLERITPPWLNFRIRTPSPIKMQAGTEIVYSLRVRGIPLRWRTIIESWNPPFEFVDTQASGPYKVWHHTHRFSERNGGTLMEDTVRYELPFGFLGKIVHKLQVRADVEKIFDYREKNVLSLIQSARR